MVDTMVAEDTVVLYTTQPPVYSDPPLRCSSEDTPAAEFDYKASPYDMSPQSFSLYTSGS